MNYNDSPKDSADYLQLALPLITRFDLPVNPINYAVFYEYVSGGNFALKEAIDAKLAKKEPLGEEYVYNIYEKYIAGQDDDRYSRIHAEARRILTEILQSVIQVDKHTSRFNASLEKYTGQLQPDIEVDLLQKLITKMLSETRSLQSSYIEIKQKLHTSTREVEKLRRDLESARREAETDPLTGLANRKRFSRVLGKAMKNASASRSDLCLMMLDIDHFKEVNDKYGHSFGDLVLQSVGDTLLKCVKGRDTACRFGGEEFAIILPDTPLKGAQKLAENIRKTIEQGKIQRTESQEIIGAITISIGVTIYHPSESAHAFIDRSDAALYRSKEKGRNRVIALP